ncbi:hypothetical protein MTP99_013463 [Tenebrio molitor]|nr:hypothetical protein MTP99_013463 [Tenebrio molitor]
MDDTTCSDRVTPTCASRFWIRGVDFSPLIERVPRKVQTNRLCSSIPLPLPTKFGWFPFAINLTFSRHHQHRGPKLKQALSFTNVLDNIDTVLR